MSREEEKNKVDDIPPRCVNVLHRFIAQAIERYSAINSTKYYNRKISHSNRSDTHDDDDNIFIYADIYTIFVYKYTFIWQTYMVDVANKRVQINSNHLYLTLCNRRH